MRASRPLPLDSRQRRLKNDARKGLSVLTDYRTFTTEELLIITAEPSHQLAVRLAAALEIIARQESLLAEYRARQTRAARGELYRRLNGLD